jgi:hypothetical protein
MADRPEKLRSRIYSRMNGWAGATASRTQQHIANNLGVIDATASLENKKFRDKCLEEFDAYYEGYQYDKMPAWDESQSLDGTPIPVRKRQPRIKFNLGKVFVDRVAAKLVGKSVFPKLAVENDPDSTEFLRLVQKACGFQHKLQDPVKRMLAAGSSFVRFYIVEGQPMIEYYLSKFCYPQYQANGELQAIRIQYVFEDEFDRDARGNPKRKWYRLDLGMTSDILYDTPECGQSDAEPTFEVVEQVDHGLGFVQGEWFRTGENKHSPDGPSLLADITDFIDELNYNLSQSSQAVSYGQEPQLTFKGMDEEELDGLVKSSTKAWALGREGSAEFLETDLKGVEAADKFRDTVRKCAVDTVRVVLLDPEKIVGSAQSGKAMEVLHGPLVELIDELRPQIEKKIINLILKISVALLSLIGNGIETAVSVPPGWQPTSLDVAATWPAIFPLTIEDLKNKAAVAVQLANASIFSRETMTRWLASDFGVEDIEAEVAKVAAQPVLNPFGAF